VERTLAQRLDSLLLTQDSLLAVSQLGLHIVNLTTGEVVYARGAQQRLRPASSEKVVTAIAALDQLGPNYQFSTRLLATAPVSGTTLQGDLYVKGAMDPLLSVADVRALAAQLKALGIRTVTGHLVADASLKDNDEYGWGWCWDDDNPKLTPLLIGGKPGLSAALLTALKNVGVTVQKGIIVGTAPAAARELTAFRRPLTAVLQPMLKESDNLCAEAVFYQLRPAPEQSGRVVAKKHASRNRIAPVMTDLITRAYNPQALPTQTADIVGGSTMVAAGSGLSLYNYQSPETFTRLLTYALGQRDSIFAPLLEALPIAGMDGTLKKRMIDTPAAANVRAKTGSVSAVSTLVGYTTQRSTGHLFAFAIMNQGVTRMAEGRDFQDRVCILLSE
jgi:D-alanyl-D-alanine carboxypeptidase/D-alanyl-D-alanine-endopeptidase (penicillin-binding protein 4)